jgi:hypothetical protein
MATKTRDGRALLKPLVLFGFLALLLLFMGESGRAQALPEFTPTFTLTMDEVAPSDPSILPADDDCPVGVACKYMWQIEIDDGQPGFYLSDGVTTRGLIPSALFSIASDVVVPDGAIVGRTFGFARNGPIGSCEGGPMVEFDFPLFDATTDDSETTSDLVSFDRWPIQLNVVRDAVLNDNPGSLLHARWVGVESGGNVLFFRLVDGSLLWVSTLGDPTATPSWQSCGPFNAKTIYLGVSRDNPDTFPDDEGGIPLSACTTEGTQTFRTFLDRNDTEPVDEVTLFDTATCSPNTDTGTDVTVPLLGGMGTLSGIDVTFAQVTTGGSTSVTGSTEGPPPPTGFDVLGLAGESFFYDINTTATVTGPVALCIGYDDTGVADEAKLQLRQYVEDPPGIFYFVDRTTYRYPDDNIICGTADTLSIWAVMLSLDSTPPVISISTPEPFAALPVGTALDFTATDAESGVQSVIGHLDDGVTTIEVSSGFQPLPGVYTLTVDATDEAGNTATQPRFFVIFDPDAGFATGGGWFIPGGPTSDEGDMLPGLDSSSPAQFGFVVKYKPGATTLKGQLEFQYRQGDFNLHSSGMEWLVLVNNNRAKFQGTATIRGVDGAFPFRVDARDSDFGGSGQPDRFSIKIWAPGANPDHNDPIHKASGDLEGGSIIIHTK